MLLNYYRFERAPACPGMLLNYRAFPGGAPIVTIVASQILNEKSLTGAPPAVLGFPTQFAGLRWWDGAVAVDMCLVAQADGPAGMGAVLTIQGSGGSIYAVYLVETSDANASPMQIDTSAGTKAIRNKT